MHEYDRLKVEQVQRISTRDNLIYATLVSFAGVIAATAQAKSPDMLLLLPPICLILGWTYLSNDHKVSAIGLYIRTVLTPRLEVLTGEPVLGWEIAHRSDAHRRSRKIGQLIIDLVTFAVPAIAALIGYWVARSGSFWLLAISGVELVAVGLLTSQMIRYSDLTTSTSTAETRGRREGIP